MELSKGELLLLEQIAKGNRSLRSIALALNKSEKQIYVYVKNLSDKGYTTLSNGNIEPKRLVHVSLLLQLLSKTPNLPHILSGSGISILQEMLKPVTIPEISKKTGYKKTAIYSKLVEARKRSLVNKNKNTFEINEQVWCELKEFLEEALKYESSIDDRIPTSAIIYYKRENEIIFSAKENIDAVKTAFSAYGQYGIELLTSTNYYYLPKKDLKKIDILMHSLYIEEKEHDIRYLIFIGLFYAKYKKELKVNHPIIRNLSEIFSGKNINGYPSYQEIKDRADVYNIKL